MGRSDAWVDADLTETAKAAAKQFVVHHRY